ncbi:hypothetical protein [Methanoplanus endosymbiosus]|uniref:Uncharacterized protein n=1 Tax=Methanoplanus endosymbiosus TaxID=33865 RepID=A0A9E7PMJ8_9EURY|nr:hypothetical protein [Methanoplanus endosymbiosus]UUX92072.1 hypothetical protein L6E24_12015 [Methanoplanus endosymbiosus]
MGLFDKLSKTVSKTSTQIGQKTKSTANDLKLKKQAKEDSKYIEGCILDRFDIKWLKNMCKYYKVAEPDPTKYNWQTGNTNKVRLTKSHWVEHCQAKLSLDQVKQYAKSHSVKISDLEREEQELKQKREAEHQKKNMQF